MKYHVAAVGALALMFLAARSPDVRSNLIAAQVSAVVPGSPTANQLIAACSSQWSTLTATGGYYRLTANGNYVNDFMSQITRSSTASLSSAPYVDDLFNRLICAPTSARGTGRCDAASRRAAQCFVDQTLAGRAGCFRTPTMTVTDWIESNTIGRQDPICRSSSASTTRPKAAVTPAPKAAAPAKKLPPARPAKMAPWSTKALATVFDTNEIKVITPEFAAERADALASCSAVIQQVTKTFPAWTPVDANLFFEETLLNDNRIKLSAEEIKRQIGNVEAHIAGGKSSVAWSLPTSRCLLQRRLARLEGSPLLSGAVDGTLTPLSIGGQTLPWKQQGKDSRIVASDGKSAMDCVELVELTKTDSGMGGGGRVLSNQCSGPVEIGWCYSPGDCDTETGSGWTLQPGRSWPVSAEKPIRWAACHGANTSSFVKGSHGLRYYCSAPAKK